MTAPKALPAGRRAAWTAGRAPLSPIQIATAAPSGATSTFDAKPVPPPESGWKPVNEAPESRVAACTTGALIGACASHTAVAVFAASTAREGDTAVEPGGDACVAPLHVPPAKSGAIVRFAVWTTCPVKSHRAVACPSGARASASVPVAPVADSASACAAGLKLPPAGRGLASTTSPRIQAATASPAVSIATWIEPGFSEPACEIGTPAENSPAASARAAPITCVPCRQTMTAAPPGATATLGESAARRGDVLDGGARPVGRDPDGLDDVRALRPDDGRRARGVDPDARRVGGDAGGRERRRRS